MDTVAGSSKCTGCVLHRTAQFVCLMGQGRVPTKIMIIGEAPGEREDDIGKPFQGRSGKLLEQLLEGIGLTREEVYITNAVRCRPPENRTPSREEIKACSTWMKKEIDEVRPSFILLLGATALKGVLKKAKITEVHGQVFPLGRAKVMPTFHPAAALRDPKRLNPMKDDFRKFWQLVNGKMPELPKINLEVVKSEKDFRYLLEDLRRCEDPEFDIETNTLDRFAPDARIHCLGLGTEKTKWILPLEIEESWIFGSHKKQVEKLRQVEQVCRQKKMAGHNGKFDNTFLWHKYGVRFRLCEDTMLTHHLLDENDYHSLKYLTRVKLNGPEYDMPLEQKIHPKTAEDRQTLFTYCGYDLHFTRELKKQFQKELAKDDALEAVNYQLVIPVARAYERIERNGFYIDPKRFQEAKQQVHTQVRQSLRKLNRYAGEEINWKSPEQVSKILFEKLKIEPVHYTPKGKPSTGEPSLLRMKKQHPVVECLLEYRGAQQLWTHFLEGWESRMVDGWLYPKYKLHGTVTGRPSCEDPNMQQVPRNKLIRSLVGAPEGWTFFELDYSQIELRLAAMAANEKNMLRIFQSGGDIHLSTACDIMGVSPDEVDEEQRKAAKAVNFGFIYGMWWKKFREYAFDKYGLILTDREAEEYRDRFFELYPDLQEWHKKQKRIVNALGQVRTLTGRIRHLPDVYSPDKKLAQEAERQSINSPIQGFGAELTLMSVVDITREYSDDQVRICGTVHDATLGRIRNDSIKELHNIRRMMEHPRLLDKLGIELKVPIIVDCKIGNWGVGEKLKRLD